MPLPLKYLGLIETGTPAENFITSGCLRPRKIFVYNSVTCKNEPLYVDCGHCIKCRDQKRNELATRMILHAKSEPWHHVYFVTLTYGSYNLNIYNKHPFKADWLETFPVQDSFNYSQRLAWTPSILVSNHFVKFMKRLRKQDQSNIISFANCGELGGKYGRPHFHAIIYSSKPLTRQNVVDAWSLDCYQKANGDVVRYAGKFCPGSRRFTFHIGKVDFYDLVANGTCDFDSVKNPSESNSSKNCFQYVAKYCVKTNGLRDMNKFALRRYHAVYDQLNEGIQYLALSGFFQLQPNEKILVTPHNGEPYYYSPSYTPYLTEEEYSDIIEFWSLKSKNFPLWCIIQQYPQFIKDFVFNESYKYKICIKNNKKYEKVTFPKFCDLFGAYFSSSRKYSLGKTYFRENFDRFKAKNFALRQVQGKTLVFPSYYYHLLERELSGFRFRARVQSGLSLCKSSLPLVYGFYSKFRENRYCAEFAKNSYLSTSCLVPSNFYHALEPDNTFSLDNGNIQPYVDSKGTLLDITLFPDGERIDYSYDSNLDYFIGMKYDRKSKSHYAVDYISRIDMCDFVLSRINNIVDSFPEAERRKKDKLTLYEKIFDFSFEKTQKLFDLALYDNPIDFLKKEAFTQSELKYLQTVSNYLDDRQSADKIYNSEHFTADKQ